MESVRFNLQEDDISINQYNDGTWRWKLVSGEDCYYNDDEYDTPGQAADAAWAFILEMEQKSE